MQVYSGGIGSYALLVMVAAFLQAHVSRAPLSAHSRATAGLDPCLGVLLLDFFRLYGRALHADYVGVSCRCISGQAVHLLNQHLAAADLQHEASLNASFNLK